MKKFLPLLLCLLLSIFTVARAAKPAHTPAPDTRSAQKNPTGQEADEKTLLNDANNDEDVPSDNDDSMAGASDNEGENMNDNDGGDAPGDQETGDNDAGDDDGGNDGSGDEGE
jgi:hypothetical protein